MTPNASLRRRALALAVTVAALAPLGVSAQEKFTLRVASFMPPQGFLSTAIVLPFLDKVVADSNGTLEYKWFPGGTLGRAPAEQLKLVQDGVADVAVVLPSFTPGAYDSFDVTQLPGVAASTRAASVGAWRAFEAGLIPSPDRVKVLGLVTTASNVLHMKTPTASLSAISGKRIRAAGGLQVDALEKLGAAAVGNIRGPEIAEALSRNLLDGVLMDWIGIKEFRVDRTATHHVDVDFGRVAIILPMNAQTWAKLPAAAKAAFEKHGGLAYAQASGQAFDDAVNQYRSDYLKTGDHVAGTFPAADNARIQAAFEAVVAAWVKEQAGRDKLLEAFRKGAAEAR
jgi:TRAP-type C4-dicarboxylate transport system substrate-binding protein